MRRSNDRILTTHTGSLPRPPALTRLYARRARGEEVDAAEIERVGRAALQGIVPKQIEAGISATMASNSAKDSSSTSGTA